MNCFGSGNSAPHTSSPSTVGAETDPSRSAPSTVSRPKPRRKNSLSIFLGSLFTPPPSPRSSPTSPSGPSSKHRSWPHGQRPIISNPLPLSLYLGDPESSLSRCVRAAFEGLPSPLDTPDSEDRPTSPGFTMDSNARASFLSPAAATTGRLRQINEAKEMTKRVEAGARKTGQEVPPYEFLELIGKGTFGRVFKSRRKKEHDLVAVKVIDVDSSDSKLAPVEKDQAIKDFVNEISVLRTLKDSKAKNINIIYDAFNFHSQLWIISEYCPGGSVSTLLKATGKAGFEEKYIIAISRELAVALKYVHDAGIIHRDVKAANVLITQDGQLQLCDFGVSGVLENNVGKRSTIIGSPFWMAPEMHKQNEIANGYGTEVDCWAFGCTVYELATGLPPNANIAPQHLHVFLSKAPRLEGGEYSSGLREFISFCLAEQPQDRPPAEKILKHQYVANTSKKYPTSILRQLIERFAQWESAGGQRASLFNQHGAVAGTAYDPFASDEDNEWNFSTTADFTHGLTNQFDPQTPDIERDDEADDETPRQTTTKPMTPFEKAQQEQRAMRGARKMARLFDENAEPYDYQQEPEEEQSITMSDLPLRRGSAARAADRETIIDLDAARVSQDMSNSTNLDLANVETIRANRGRLRFLDDDDGDDVEEYQQRVSKRLTRDWRFSAAGELTAPARSIERDTSYTDQSTDEDDGSHLSPPPRPMLKHTTTEPLGNFGDYLHPASAFDASMADLSYEPPDRSSMIDLDGAGFSTLSRQHSFASSAGESASTDFGNADPFYLDDNEVVYNENTIRAKRTANRVSSHMHSQSEPSAGDRTSNGHLVHTRGSSLSSESELERQQRQEARHEASVSSAPLSRTVSIENSNESLRKATSGADAWERDISRFGGGLEEKHQPLYPGSSLRKFTDDDTDEALSSAADVDASDVDSARGKEDTFAYRLANQSPKARQSPQASKMQGNRDRASRQGRSRGKLELSRRRRGVDPNIDGTEDEAIGAVPSHRQHRRVVSFPRPQAPDFQALEEDAEPETVLGEMDRLLDDFAIGLRAMGRLLGDSENVDQSRNGFHRNKPRNRPPQTGANDHQGWYDSSRSMSASGE